MLIRITFTLILYVLNIAMCLCSSYFPQFRSLSIRFDLIFIYGKELKKKKHRQSMLFVPID